MQSLSANACGVIHLFLSFRYCPAEVVVIIETHYYVFLYTRTFVKVCICVFVHVHSFFSSPCICKSCLF